MDTFRPSGTADWVGSCGLAVVLLGCFLLVGTPPWTINHDCGWYLYAADRFLTGDALYVDLVEVNPPLIVYLSVLPTLLARMFSIGLVPAFDVFVVLWICVSLFAIARVIREVPVVARSKYELIAGIAVVLTVCAGNDFGQREHLMVIAVVPWLMVVMARQYGAPVGGVLAFCLGCFAAVGIALKPWFLLVPFITRIGVVQNARELFTLGRPEDRGMLLMLVIYMLHFLFAPLTSDFMKVLERLGETNHGMEIELVEVLKMPWCVHWFWVCGAALLLLLFVKSMRRELLVWTLACVAAGISAVWQQKGWSYHFLPALSLGYIALGLMLCGVVVNNERMRRNFRPLWFVGLVLFTAVPAGEHWLRRHPTGLVVEPEFTGIPDDMREIEGLTAGESVMVLDTAMPPFFAWLGDHRIQSASRYAHLWTLPVALRDGRQWQQLLVEITEDIRRRRPRYIYLRKGQLEFCPTVLEPFSVRLVQAPEMRVVLEEYRQVQTSGRFGLWQRTH
ncbi:MAG: hypothetical protein VX951_05070 [Planctomycetota bacterium]|nr:hypothetical protein [Planctomycetota bacterium]